MYSFGGLGNDGCIIPLDKILSVNLDTFFWKEIQTSGEIPPPVFGHTANTIDDSIYIFAGRTDNGETNELYRFTPGHSSTWK